MEDFDNPFGPDGDMEDCKARCAKCNQLRLRWNDDGKRWCRRCKYEYYDEYFGPDGVNEQAIRAAGLWADYKGENL